jgi:hypothetical protein
VLVQISTVVIANGYVVRLCLECSVNDVGKCGFVIAEDWKRFVVLVVIVLLTIFDNFEKLQ